MIDRTNRRNKLSTALDLALIATIAFVAQATNFSAQQGRSIICGDSAQYVASAEALLDPGETPHFEMRKPGYILFLAGVQLAFGNMGWAAISLNHVLLGLLPLIAYGFGRHLHGRVAGWLAALLVTVRLQDIAWGNRMMSEALFTALFSLGLLLFVVALSRKPGRGWMIAAGSLLGLAWLTRGSATPAIVAAAVAVVVVMRNDWRRALTACSCFALPILGCIAIECGLNLTHGGQFRPSNGTVGVILLLRARHFEGMEMPDLPESAQALAWLPERDPNDAFLANHLDIWVARYRAIHDFGMNEWEYDTLMGRVGTAALASDLSSYLISGLRLTAHHLMRSPDGLSLSPIPSDRRLDPVRHAASMPDDDWDATWFAYYGLPHLGQDESKALIDRMNTAAQTRAPFGESELWSALRYWKTNPMAARSMQALAWLGSLWPGLALIGCIYLGLNRTCCALLAFAYLLDALFIGFLTPTNTRLQFIWIVCDSALVAGLTVGVATIATAIVRAQLQRLVKPPTSEPRTSAPADARNTERLPICNQ